MNRTRSETNEECRSEGSPAPRRPYDPEIWMQHVECPAEGFKSCRWFLNCTRVLSVALRCCMIEWGTFYSRVGFFVLGNDCFLKRGNNLSPFSHVWGKRRGKSDVRSGILAQYQWDCSTFIPYLTMYCVNCVMYIPVFLGGWCYANLSIFKFYFFF